MARIKVLPETVQNKIAAGEVIERPASVVKELVENAMDAGSTLIEVEIEEGGHRLIRVSDNGCGMDESDLVASLQRHATSKISDVDDIFRISTFGFRGEALPSIGSVSRLTISTGTGETEAGHELLVEGGRMIRLSPAAPRRGTRVEVGDIFFNTPARRKFLRQPASETTQTVEVLTRLALGNPQISFRLQTNDRLRLSVKGVDDQLARIGEIFGPELAGKMVPFMGEIADGLTAHGHFARPPASYRNSSHIYVLVNRRWIRFYGLAKAVSDEFAGILPPREYPIAIVNLSVDPQRVDVNVHPTKEEVRFDHDRVLIGGVRRIIREAMQGLAGQPTASTFLPLQKNDGASAPAGAGEVFSKAGKLARESPPPWDKGGQKRLNLPPRFVASGDSDWKNLNLAEIRGRLRSDAPEFFPQTAAHLSVDRPDMKAPEPSPLLSSPVSVPDGSGLAFVGSYRILGQAAGGYIIVDCPEGLLAVDPHALHERWNYDKLVEARQRGGDSVRLLLPLELTLSPIEMAAAEEAIPELAEFGFEFNILDEKRLAVLAAPSFIKPHILEKLVRQVLADGERADAALRSVKKGILASVACHSSVLLGKTLPQEEIEAIMEWFFAKGQLPTCPHGRPTAVNITKEELDRRFCR